MRHLITIAALLLAANTAQADTVIAQTQFTGETYYLTDKPCQRDPRRMTAAHQRWGQAEMSLACYELARDGRVYLDWYWVENRNRLNDSIPQYLFHRAR